MLLFPRFWSILAVCHRRCSAKLRYGARRDWRGLCYPRRCSSIYHAHPGLELRLGMQDEPLQALAAGDVSVVLKRAASCLAAFIVPGQGDDFLAYNTPGRPFLDPITGVLFLAGVVISLFRVRQPGYAMALLWFAISISPSLITGAAASTTRSITALPPTFLFPAIAAVTGAQWIASRWGRRAGQIAAGALIVFVIASGVLGARDYNAWGRLPQVRAAYLHTLVQTFQYLDRRLSLPRACRPLPQAAHILRLEPAWTAPICRRAGQAVNGADPARTSTHASRTAVATLDPYLPICLGWLP